MADGYRVTQAEYPDMTVGEFLDDRFVGILSKAFPDFTAINISIFTGDEKNSIVQLIHPKKSFRDEHITLVDSTSPEAFEKIISVIETYRSEE